MGSATMSGKVALPAKVAPASADAWFLGLHEEVRALLSTLQNANKLAMTELTEKAKKVLQTVPTYLVAYMCLSKLHTERPNDVSAFLVKECTHLCNSWGLEWKIPTSDESDGEHDDGEAGTSSGTKHKAPRSAPRSALGRVKKFTMIGGVPHEKCKVCKQIGFKPHGKYCRSPGPTGCIQRRLDLKEQQQKKHGSAADETESDGAEQEKDEPSLIPAEMFPNPFAEAQDYGQCDDRELSAQEATEEAASSSTVVPSKPASEASAAAVSGVQARVNETQERLQAIDMLLFLQTITESEHASQRAAIISRI